MIIDVHSHLNDKQFDADREEVIKRQKTAGVSTITVGTDLEMSRKAIEIAEQNSWWASVGKHPVDNTAQLFDPVVYRELGNRKCVVAIGECGLDYYWEKSDQGRASQKDLFLKQLVLAHELGKPLMIHCRAASDDMLAILYEHNDLLPTPPGDIHFFTDTWDIAKKFIDLGFAISFPGVITFTDQYDELVKNVPKDQFMVETDAPYAAPVPYRAGRNEPVYVLEVVKKIALLRGVSPEQIAELSSRNANRVFSLGLQV